MFATVPKASLLICLSVLIVEITSQHISLPKLDPSKKDKFVSDPFIFYKWPGFAQAEGLFGQWPWYPAFVIDRRKNDDDEANDDEDAEKDEEDAQDDKEDEEEDDEPEDDFDSYSKYHKDHEEEIYYKPYRKQKPVAVSSVGFGPAIGKPTWYGVLNAKVNSRSDLDLLDIDSSSPNASSSGEEEEDEVIEQEEVAVQPRFRYMIPKSSPKVLLIQPQSQEYFQPRPPSYFF